MWPGLFRWAKFRAALFAVGEGLGFCLGTECLDAHNAVFDDPHVTPVFDFPKTANDELLSLNQPLTIFVHAGLSCSSDNTCQRGENCHGLHGASCSDRRRDDRDAS